MQRLPHVPSEFYSAFLALVLRSFYCKLLKTRSKLFSLNGGHCSCNENGPKVKAEDTYRGPLDDVVRSGTSSYEPHKVSGVPPGLLN